MSTFVRASKYRHVYVDTPKLQETFSSIRLSTAVGEGNYIKANPNVFAIALSGGGGPFTVLRYDKKGPLPINQPVFNGHTSNVLDFDFNPFNDYILASGSEDTTIKVWGIPEEGLTENISDPLVDLRGHEKKVTLLRFHPTASNVLGSTSFDNSVKLWDIERAEEIFHCDAHDQLIQDLIWDHRGNAFATTNKDKVLRLFDGRTGKLAQSRNEAHDGSKSSKAVYLGNRELILTVGFTKQSQRQMKIWDTRNLDKGEIKSVDIDQAAGVIMPFFDPDTNLLYLAGKGDGNIRYYEIVDEAPFIFPVSEYRSTVSCKGCAFVPKRGLDVMKCETARLMKLTTSSVEPLSFIVPRKGDFFQEDIFPPTYAGIAAHSAQDWLSGSDKEPPVLSLDPSVRAASTAAGGLRSNSPPNFLPKSSSSAPASSTTAVNQQQQHNNHLQKELEAANARIALLESRLRAAGLDYS